MSVSPSLAFFVPNLAGGGAERVVLTLCGAFARAGHAVDLLLTRRRGAFADRVPPGVRVVDFDAPRTVAAGPALVRYLYRDAPDVLVTALSSATVVGAAACALPGVSTALCATVHNLPTRLRSRANRGAIRHPDRRTEHSPREGRRRSLWRAALLRLLPVALRRADAVVAVSHAVAADLRADAGLSGPAFSGPAFSGSNLSSLSGSGLSGASSGTLHVIHNPIDVPAIRAAARRATAPPHPWLAPNASGAPPVPVVLGAGRLCAQKDFPTLLRAVARVRRHRRIRCIVLGEGPDRRHIEALASDLGLADAVALPGFVDDPYAFMRWAQVFALSSAWEPFGNVVVEAMACGTPVVVTGGAGGASEIVRPRTPAPASPETRFDEPPPDEPPHGSRPPADAQPVGPVVPPGDPAALARAIHTLLDAPTDPQRLVRRAEAFDVPHAVDAYRRVFDALGARAAASPARPSPPAP